MQKVQEKKILSICYAVHYLQNLIMVLKFFKLCTGNIKISSVSKKLPVPVAARSKA